MNVPIRLGLLLTAMVLAGCGQQSAPDGMLRDDGQGNLSYGTLSFTPCSLSAPGQAVEAYCSKVAVPENPDVPDGHTISLAIALVPSRGLAQADPVYMIAGGPGQSALESYPQVHRAFDDVRRNRHVLLVDARGTGGSNPLRCDAEEDANEGMFDVDTQTAEQVAGYAADCRRALEGKADLRFYTTADHVRDLDTIRTAIGAPQVNLVGVSYGTRVAQQYAATYPERTRAVVLDSVVPNTLVLGQEHARNLEDALQALFAGCRSDAACLENLGDPAQQLDTVRGTLQASQLAPVRYRDPVSGDWREETPRFGHLQTLLRMYAYQPQYASTLPLLLHEASQGRYESLLAQARLMASDLTDAIYYGMHLSVVCAEDVPDMRPDPADQDTVLGDDITRMLIAQCDAWPRGGRAGNFREPLRGDVALLAISGERDPVTPPRYGDEVVADLPAARHLVLPGQGHSVLGTGCMPKLLAQFIERADAQSLDASCLERLAPQPPFAGNYGWEP